MPEITEPEGRPGGVAAATDELEFARGRKRYQEIMQRLNVSIAADLARVRNQARLFLWTEALSEAEVQEMLRGQILCEQLRDRRPCQEDGTDEDFASPCDIEDEEEDEERFEVVHRRDARPAGLFGPLDPVPVPRNHLQCPLWERARKGDAAVPCWIAQQQLPKGARLPPPRTDEEKLPRLSLQRVIELRLTPCATFHQLARDTIEDLVHVSPPALARPAEAPAEGGDLAQRRVRRSLRVFQEHAEGTPREQADGAQAGLRFLLLSERLDRGDLVDLLDQQIYITDNGWLPCRDDLQRNLAFTCEHQNLDDDHFIAERYGIAPPSRQLCPMQARARLGDRTTPCCEALLEPADPAWIAAEERGAELERQRGDRDSREEEEARASRQPPPPAYWSGPHDQPGAPGDPVIVHRVRPCHLVGILLARHLYPLAQALADDPEEMDAPAGESGPPGAFEEDDYEDEDGEDEDEDDEDED